MATLRSTLARLVRDARIMLDITQRELAAAVGVSRAHIASIETGRCNPSLDVIQRISDRLELALDLTALVPQILTPRRRDLVHAWCMGYVERRLRRAGYSVRREVEVLVGRSHAWVDLVAFDPRTRTLFLIEIKTRIDDLGALERQVDWYEREAWALAQRFGWVPQRVVTWVLALASDEVEATLRVERDGLRSAFPGRAKAMRSTIAGVAPDYHRAIALIDPASRRREWLIPSRVDGRRSAARYRDYAQAAAARHATASLVDTRRSRTPRGATPG